MTQWATLASRSLQIAFDVFAEIHALDVGALEQLIVGPGHGRHALRRLFQMERESRIANVARLKLQHARDDHQAVLHPVAHLLQQHLMAFQRRLEVARVALALDRHAEDVGGALQESEIVLDELVLRAAVDLEHPERPAVALQDDVHGAVDAVLRRISGVRKRSSFSRWLEITGLPVRSANPAGEARSAPMLACADDACVPADAGPDQQPVLGRDVFQHLAELGPQRLGGEPRRFGQELVEVGALQGGHAQLGQNFLLADTLMQSTQGEVRGPARRLGLDHRLFLFVRRAHEAAVPTLPSADKRHVRSATRMQGRANDRARFRSRCGADSASRIKGLEGSRNRPLRLLHAVVRLLI